MLKSQLVQFYAKSWLHIGRKYYGQYIRKGSPVAFYPEGLLVKLNTVQWNAKDKSTGVPVARKDLDNYIYKNLVPERSCVRGEQYSDRSKERYCFEDLIDFERENR